MKGDFYLAEAVPKTFVAPQASAEVTDISPSFVAIRSQAAQAEVLKLDQIAGVGYRKALEFLIKDYCISIEPGARAAIEAEFLGATIKNRVSDTQVKAVAERAAWLGNDETHYTKKWQDKDISDLKTLINLAMNWIQNSILTTKYLNDMPPP